MQAHYWTPPKDVQDCRGRSPGLRTVALVGLPDHTSVASSTSASRLQLRGRSGFPLSTPDCLLALVLWCQRTTTRRSMKMLRRAVNW